jgi:hypothetical protein
LVYEPAHCIAYAGPLQFHGEYRLLAVLHNSTSAQGKFLKGEFAAFPFGKALGGPAPTAHAVGQGSGNAALFESLSHLGEGGLCGQGVRWNVPTSIPGALPSAVAKGMSASHPPPRTTPTFPRRPISGQCGSPQAGLLVVRCQLPDARGRLPTGQLPQLKQVYPSASTLRLRG